MTAYGLVETLAAPEGEWIIQTAAGSVLGRQLVVLAKRKGVRTINVVRRSAQKDELLQLGYESMPGAMHCVGHTMEASSRSPCTHERPSHRHLCSPASGLLAGALAKRP